jgi:hypothetical protein
MATPFSKQGSDPSKWRMRNPADSPEGLIGPYLAHGGCLGEDFMPSGRTLRWYDPTEPAHDGDIVLCQLTESFIDELVEVKRDNLEWRRKYGARPSGLCTKLLRHFRGGLWMFEQDNGVPLEGRGHVLGVLRYCMVDGEPRFGSGADTGGWSEIAAQLCDDINIAETSGVAGSGNIDLNAATEVLYAHDAGPIVESNATSTPNAADILTVAVTLDHATDTVQVVVSGRVEIEQTVGSTFQKVLLASAATFDPPAQPYDTADSFEATEEGTFNFALAGSFTTLSNQTGDYQFGLRLGIFTGGSSRTVQCTFRDVNLTVAVFKR